jgi:NAD(P)H-dependent FMN reductase
MRVLAISGSLRSQSTNTSLLRALAALAPSNLEIVLYTELDQIPPFNPDLELNSSFDSVNRFRDAIRQSDAVIFSTPEYAHGIPGSLKNALDWIVGSGELSEKPVALCNASSRAVYAQAALKEVLTAMNTKLLVQAEITVDLPRRDMTPQEIAAHPELANALRSSLHVLLAM